MRAELFRAGGFVPDPRRLAREAVSFSPKPGGRCIPGVSLDVVQSVAMQLGAAKKKAR
jgi:hypothetical protein